MNISNRVQTVAKNNISNTDVWIQKINSAGAIVGEVVKVDNDTRETAIYNSLRSGTSDIVSVNTTIDNGVELHYPDGIFGNSAFGNYRVWYRVVDNESYSVDRTSIENAEITIPYIGADGVSHTLRLTLSTTRDFAENYEAENFISVKRIAPRSYYAQDRMVNGQDYNVLPLSLGSNVVKKVKAINTNFSGNSRYFEMDDVTGHHSNVTVNARDGSMFIDDDNVSASLFFNRDFGNSLNFIRNEISKVIKHQSLANKYYINAINGIPDERIIINETTRETFYSVYIEIDPTNPKTIFYNRFPEPDPGEEEHPAERMYPGDFIKIESIDIDTGEKKYYWTQIYGAKQSGGGTSNTSYIVKDIIPNNNANLYIVEIVKGFRTRFEKDEIVAIKNVAFDNDTASNSFQIKYVYDDTNDRWVWVVHDEQDDGYIDDTDVQSITENAFLNLSYNPGSRVSEAEYKVKFNGKKIVFESSGSVKFFYNNFDKVVDLETNLAARDKLIIDYFDPQGENVRENEDEFFDITLGSSILHNLTRGESTTTFKAIYNEKTGAPKNLRFAESELFEHSIPLPSDETQEEFTFYKLLDGYGNESIFDSNEIKQRFVKDYTNIIGDNYVWEIDVEIDNDDLTETNTQDPVVNEGFATEDTPEMTWMGPFEATLNPTSNTSESTVTINALDIKNELNTKNYLKGLVDYNYISEALDTKNFVLLDDDKLTTIGLDKELTYDQVTTATTGVFTSFGYSFNNSNEDLEIIILRSYIDENSSNIYLKQFAYAEIEFESSRSLTQNNVRVKVNDNLIDNRHFELLGDFPNYKIVFWTTKVEEADTINVYDILTGADLSLENYSLRVDVRVKNKNTVAITYPKTNSLTAYMYDTVQNNFNQVKLMTMDSTKNPLGTVLSIKDRYIVLKKSERNGRDIFNTTNEWEYEIVDNDNLKVTRISNNSDTFMISDFKNALPFYNDTYEIKVVKGISHYNGELVSYIWDHYADKDKRIDPSTSNIVDVYVLTADYTRKIEAWKNSGFAGQMPKAANNYELKKLMENIKGKESISDHVSYVPVRFKPLFGSQASQENQAIFKVVKKSGTLFTDSEIKSGVSTAVNNFFKLENWDFGDTFYFSELAAHIHKECAELISSVVITPKYSGSEFTKLLSITSEPNEIFMSVTTSADVKIIERITDLELSGE
jgi:hypothetical protein